MKNIKYWKKLEKKYSLNKYDGKNNSTLFLKNKYSNVLLVNTHGTNHYKLGKDKVCDLYTGGLTELLAKTNKTNSIISQGKQPNPLLKHLYKF